MMDDDSDSDSGGGAGFDFGHDWGFSQGNGWLRGILGRGGDHSSGEWGGDIFDAGWWKEFLLRDCLEGSGLKGWFKLKIVMWAMLIDHIHDHHNPPAAVPLPAPLLFLGSGLIGLLGLARRSRSVAKSR